MVEATFSPFFQFWYEAIDYRSERNNMYVCVCIMQDASHIPSTRIQSNQIINIERKRMREGEAKLNFFPFRILNQVGGCIDTALCMFSFPVRKVRSICLCHFFQLYSAPLNIYLGSV